MVDADEPGKVRVLAHQSRRKPEVLQAIVDVILQSKYLRFRGIFRLVKAMVTTTTNPPFAIRRINPTARTAPRYLKHNVPDSFTNVDKSQSIQRFLK